MAHAVRRLLLEANLVKEDQLARIEGWYDLLDRSLVEKCYRSSLVSDEDLLKILVDQGAVDASQTLADSPPVDAALGALSRELAERHRAIPLSVSPNEVVIGMLDPFDNLALKQIRAFAFLPVKAVAVRAGLLFPALTKAYDVEDITPVEDPAQFLSDTPPEDKRPRLERFAPAPVDVSGDASSKPDVAPPPPQEVPATTDEIAVKRLADAAFPSEDDAPVVESPASEQPAAEQPTAQQPAAQQPAPEQPAAQQPAAQQPAPEQPAAQQLAAEQPPAGPATTLPSPTEAAPVVPPETTPAPIEAVPAIESPDDSETPAIPPASTPAMPNTSHPTSGAWKPDVPTTSFSASRSSPPERTFESFEAFREATFTQLVPPFRVAILLGIDDQIARGWAVSGGKIDATQVNALEIPLDVPSAFRRAWEWSMVAAGSKLEPSRAERNLFNAIHDDAPSTFAVFPIKFKADAKHPQVLLYVDVAEGLLNEDSISVARQHAEAMVATLGKLAEDDKLPS